MNSFEKLLSLLTKIRPGEGRGILILGANGFLLMCTYFILKTLREPLILIEFSAETKSYAVATIAVVLFFVVPLYGVLFRATNRTQLVLTVNLFFVFNIIVFALLHNAGISIAFGYFVWIGIFGVMVVAQFWAYTTDIYNVKSGQRIFPVIMIATSLGGLVGAQLSASAFSSIGVVGLMAIAGFLLSGSMMLYRPARLAAPDDSRCIECEFAVPKYQGVFGGFAVVMSDHYLKLIALFVVLLNWINSTGEYILSAMVVEWAEALSVQAGESKDELIAWFYGNYAFWTTLLGLFLQTFVVAKVIRRFGIPRCLMVLPVVSFIGYTLFAFIPIFSIIRLVKISENGIDTSLTSTLRQALFLPTSREVKYEGKTAIDTFFWRFGDLIQGGAIFVGINHFGFGIADFALMNAALACVWLGVAYLTARQYQRVVKLNATSLPPVLNKPIIDLTTTTGVQFELKLDEDTFVDPDPGDTISLEARLANGQPLPSWLSFSPHRALFRGTPPISDTTLEIEIIASDFESLTANAFFKIHCVAQTATLQV